MQATIGVRRPRLNKQLVVASAALMTAFVLGGASGYLAKGATIGRPVGERQAIIAATGAADAGSAWGYGLRRSGTQYVDGPAAAPSAAPVLHEPGSRLGGNRI